MAEGLNYMAQNFSIHVTHGESGWEVSRAGDLRPIFVHRYQEDAVQHARDVAAVANVSMVVHRKDGSVAGNDVKPSRGRAR